MMRSSVIGGIIILILIAIIIVIGIGISTGYNTCNKTAPTPENNSIEVLGPDSLIGTLVEIPSLNSFSLRFYNWENNLGLNYNLTIYLDIDNENSANFSVNAGTLTDLRKKLNKLLDNIKNSVF